MAGAWTVHDWAPFFLTYMDPLKVSPPQEAKLHFLDYWRIIRIRKTVILAVFLLVVITATLVTFVLPQKFSSTASIRVERDQTDITSLTTPYAGAGGYDPYFIQTEFEVIQSQLILGKVIDQLDLRNRWAKKFGVPELKQDEAMAILRSSMSLRPVRNTELIEITIVREDNKEAAELAETIAVAYRDYRLDERKRRSSGGIAALENRIKEENVAVEKQQKVVDDLRDKLKISDTLASGDMPTTLMTADSLRRLEALRIESQTELTKEKTLLERLQAYKTPEELAEAIPTSGIQDSQLTTLCEDLVVADQRLVTLNKDYGPKYSESEKIKDAIDDLKTKINRRVAGILSGLDTRVASGQAALDTLSNEVDKATQRDIEKANSSRPYFEAKRKLEELNRFATALNMKVLSEQTDSNLPKTGMVEIVNHARQEFRPVSPKVTLNISLGVIIGLVVGIGLAFFIEYLDTSVKTIDDVERTLQSPVLGVIPQNVGLILDEGAESPHAEAYRVLRTNLLFSRRDEKLNCVAVISAGAGEGKSTTVFNLASVFAQSGQRVLMVDSDLRRPTLHKMLRVSNNIGLTNYLLKQNTLEEVIQTTGLPTLDFMASGKLPSSSLGILSSSQMKDLINELKQHYDFIFFDSPPVMGVSDASILASEVDMTLQVIQYRRYPQPMNIRAKQLIEKVGGNLVGIVLNNINMSQDESYYYYSGYYHDYYSRDEEQEPTPPAGDAAGSKAS